MKFRPLKHRELIARLKRLGLEGPFSGGRHLYFLLGKLRLTVPNPHEGDVSRRNIKAVIDKLKMTAEEFYDL